MSNAVSDQTGDGSANTGNQESNNGTVSYDTHRKLLGEKKAKDAALAEALAKLESLEQEKLKSEGNKDELIKQLQSKAQSGEEKLKKVIGAFQYRAISNKFVEKARAEGCLKPEKLMQLADLNNVEVDIDNDFAVNEESVTSIIEGLKKEVPFFFQKNQVKVIDQVPNSNTTSTTDTGDLSKKSVAELMAMAKSLDAQQKR